MNLRKAIITGSLNYEESPLTFPEKDMELIGETLRKRCKFEKDDVFYILHTNKVEDLTFLEQIKTQCEQLNDKRTNVYDLIVFYYSGHGVYKTEEGMSFLQISDNTYVPIDEVIEIVSTVNARNKYFIVDACQSGGFSLLKPKGKIQRQYTFNSKGIYCMFGTTKHQLAFEPTIRDVIKKKVNNSFYTHFIAEALNSRMNYNEDTISIRVVDDYASKKTPTYTNFEQIPFSTTEITGYFPFGFWEEIKELKDISEWESKTNNSTQYLPNRETDIVDYLTDKIKRLFSENNLFFNFPDKELLNNLTQPAIDLLNDNLGLNNLKYNEKPLINGLISCEDNNKYQFLIFILEQQKISIDLNLTDKENKTVLHEAIFNSAHNSFYTIQLLFIRGYKLKDSEEALLIELFTSKTTRPEHNENIAISLICHKLQEPELIFKSLKIISEIFSILSIKTGKIVGFKINQIALVNNFLQHYQKFSSLFIRALKVYKIYDDLKSKPSFMKKLNSIIETAPFQETEYDAVFEKLFPELFE